MRKILAGAVLGLAVAALPLTGAQAATQTSQSTHLAQSTQWRGHFTTGVDCRAAGNNILMTSPKAQTYECRPFNLGGFDLYVTYD
ncbi:hypothetical protein [Kribbella solani]|uniref:TctA family transporter n=1 Tax=Kribbella solani TaxID=236067 RepID=A0A841E3I5_9ACTN|nr:hypothetical protein [Kribbella solani]MBB5983565.1 TctA family transporter [Kribbella solani]